MATRTEIVNECDGCGRADDGEHPVTTHELVIDGNTARRESCGRCWNRALAGLAKVFGDAFDAGRQPGEIVCLDCTPPRPAKTKAGLAAHRRTAHNGAPV